MATLPRCPNKYFEWGGSTEIYYREVQCQPYFLSVMSQLHGELFKRTTAAFRGTWETHRGMQFSGFHRGSMSFFVSAQVMLWLNNSPSSQVPVKIHAGWHYQQHVTVNLQHHQVVARPWSCCVTLPYKTPVSLAPNWGSFGSDMKSN